jgi:hypothetical protein
MSGFLTQRRIATEATMAEFSDRPFEWGKSDCVSIVIYHAGQLGRADDIPELKPYSTPTGALRRLKEMGFDTLEELMDSVFERIPVNSTINGDFVLLAGDSDGLDALGVKAGHFIFGFHQDSECPKVCILSEAIGAWRG